MKKQIVTVTCLSLMLLGTIALATDITWTASRLVDVNGLDISTDGVLLEALNMGRESLGGDVLVNDVNFVGKHDVNDTEFFAFDPNGFATGPGSGVAYDGNLPFGDALLDGFYWTPSENDVNEIILLNLLPGEHCLLQVLLSDDRGVMWGTDYDTRYIDANGVGDINTTNYGSTVDPLIMTGVFTAENESEAFVFDVVQDSNSTHSIQINAVQLRSLGTGATFDWSEATEPWWGAAGYGYTETRNDITMDQGGRTSAHPNGNAFKATYPQDEAPGTFTCLVDNEAVSFVLLSVDLAADFYGYQPETGIDEVSLTGMKDGEVQWVIAPTEDSDFVTYTEATTGDMSLPIDEIVWVAPWSAASGNQTDRIWGNKVDNMKVVVPW